MTKARTLADNFAADINGITAGTGITGGGTSGTVTITNEMATTITAKGDLLAGTGNAAFDNLAAGASGETLVADSSTTTGLRYQTGVNTNGVINGAMDIWQRGTSIANTATYVYAQDRYRMGAATAQTTTRQAVNDTTNLPNIQYCARMQRNSGSTSTTDIVLGYSAESADSYRFAGQTITFSFYARAGANYSAASSAFRAVVTSGTGTDQNILSGYTGAATVINATPTLTTTWQRFSYTGTVAATATEIGHTFFYTPVGTAGANDYAEVTGVQLELGSVATTFKRAGATLAGELAACQRYFNRTSVPSGQVGFSNGMCQSATSVFHNFWGVSLRAAPTVTINGTLQTISGNTNATMTSTNAIYWVANNQSVTVNFVSSGMTAGQAAMLYAATSGISIDLSSEL